MPGKTTFLELTLPQLGEFIDTWHEVLNQNFEDIDSWVSDLYQSLVGSSATTTWQSLRGSLTSLSARLAVSINADGTINLSSNPALLELATSSYDGEYTAPRDRMDGGDQDRWKARPALASSRFDAAAPSAILPRGTLDAGIAHRTADYGAKDADHPIASPPIPWSPGLVSGVASLFVATGTAKVDIMAGTTPAVFDIDGFLFRVREQVTFDFGSVTPLADNDYVWLFVERPEASYNNALFKYGPAPSAAKDLRKLQSGEKGVATTATSIFTDATTPAKFTTAALGKVHPGDLLIIESGDNLGEYVVDSVDSDTQLTIKGVFKSSVDLSNQHWHIFDEAMPNIGAVSAGLSASDMPPRVAGRVYVGRCRHRAGLDPDSEVTFAKGGVYDSGWMTADADVLATTGLALNHLLGCIPTRVDVWFRASAAGDAYPPLVERQVLTNFDTSNTTVEVTDPKSATLLFPSIKHWSSLTAINIKLLDASTDPAKPSALFTDSTGTDITSGHIRVIARR